MKYALFAAASLAAFVSSPAFAADIDGARVEGIVGYDIVDMDLGLDGIDDKMEGVSYGVGLGYDFAVGPKMAFGIDAEIADSSTDLSAQDPNGNAAKVSMGRDLYAGARLTTAVSDSFNLYGKLGYTNARAKVSVDDGTTSYTLVENLDGVRAGVGGQFLVGGNSYVGLEYRYSNYENDVERHQVAATLGFRF